LEKGGGGEHGRRRRRRIWKKEEQVEEGAYGRMLTWNELGEKELAVGVVWKDWITRTWKNRRFIHVKKAKKRRKKQLRLAIPMLNLLTTKHKNAIYKQ
jgi:hypothetical protein